MNAMLWLADQGTQLSPEYKKDQDKYFTSKAANCATFTNSMQQNKVNPAEEKYLVECCGTNSKITESHGGLSSKSYSSSKSRHLSNVILKVREDYSYPHMIHKEQKVAKSLPNSLLRQEKKLFAQTKQITPRLSIYEAKISNDHICLADGGLQASSSNSCYKNTFARSRYVDFNKLLQQHPIDDSFHQGATIDKKLKLNKINEIFDIFVPAMRTTN